jgi:hypothetical protein
MRKRPPPPPPAGRYSVDPEFEGAIGQELTPAR